MRVIRSGPSSSDDDLKAWLVDRGRLDAFEKAIKTADSSEAFNLLSGFGNDWTSQATAALVDLYLEKPELLDRLRS